jgi:hypothetical protein
MSDGYLIKLRLSLMGRPVRNYTFEKPVISVGRDPGADVYVDNPGVSRDHFRLERTENGEYQVVDLGSANGTFVNDQMVNASVVHNNDVVRFGKYTLWIGYEVDRRASSRNDKAAALAEAQGSGHTVVLSRAELGKILEHEKEKEKPAEPAKVVPIAMPIAPQPPPPRAEAPPSTWPSLIAGFILGTLFGAGAIWLLLNR